jgi:hypothetical protein
MCAIGIAVAAVPDESTHGAIVSLMQVRMHVPVLIVGPMAEEGDWILTRWDTGEPGHKGEALAKYDRTHWIIVRSNTGSMEKAAYLTSIGVPASTASALVKDMKKL